MSNTAHNAKPIPKVLQYLSSNLRGYRQQAGLSQMALAELSGVSRRMLAGIEAGDRNVSLAVLDKIAAALAISFTDLIQAPEARQPYGRGIGLARRAAGQPGAVRRQRTARQRAELWEWTLMPGERYDSAPDAEGWSEMIYVIAGTLTLELEQDTLTLTAGTAQTFNSDQRYAYANHGDLPLRFIRNVAF